MSRINRTDTAAMTGPRREWAVLLPIGLLYALFLFPSPEFNRVQPV
jgi:hypothetical protein